MRAAIAQMTAGEDVSANLDWMTSTVAGAAEDGCRLVAFPENATQLAPEAVRLRDAEALDGRQIATMRDAAARRGVWVLVGSFAEVGPDAGHTYNTSVLINPSGGLAAVYRKIHLFDVDIAPDTRLHESASVAPGPPEPVSAAIDAWRIGLSVCYDLRFPELYRALVGQGATLLAVPAAFTHRTGAAHWHVLLRARAIENLAYVIAPAQVGRHYGGRESYGHALVVAPWGEVIAEAEEGVRWLAASLDLDRVRALRAAIPCLSHRRLSP